MLDKQATEMLRFYQKRNDLYKPIDNISTWKHDDRLWNVNFRHNTPELKIPMILHIASDAVKMGKCFRALQANKLRISVDLFGGRYNAHKK